MELGGPRGEDDVIMPGFRFHPTEEELVEFYLRRKVEGKRFNVELITSLDLYRYDPWELPAMAAIGEKEWYFYVPRDRKYRNGDRPNRVTTSGYWKATGADRVIRNESLESVGLKKTLVFYSGKAPRGVRTSWIMNEYRLPQNDTHKTETSLCRVYKRTGVADSFPAKSSAKTPKPTAPYEMFQQAHVSETSSSGSMNSSSRSIVNPLANSGDIISSSRGLDELQKVVYSVTRRREMEENAAVSQFPAPDFQPFFTPGTTAPVDQSWDWNGGVMDTGRDYYGNFF
ncbi:hypothetical protein M569_10928 [Genlisea aurea]|uniref:NAC domain-containing protein n=1 Tax=Genlisea aurea TaxID=192259 RepID=S8CH56_9LAMI|nr:hypothetical protein M569_10928 [Genlisea aurea]